MNFDLLIHRNGDVSGCNAEADRQLAPETRRCPEARLLQRLFHREAFRVRERDVGKGVFKYSETFAIL
jgi:hypothetical protein